MKLLVVGATGMVGSEVVKIAVDKGLTVKALIRKDDSTDKIAEVINKIKCYEGDVLDSDSIISAMQDGIEMLFTQLADRNIHAEPVVRSYGLQELLIVALTGGGPTPRTDSPLAESHARVGDDQVWIDLHLGPKAGAYWASTVGAVEGKGAWLDLGQVDSALRASQVL